MSSETLKSKKLGVHLWLVLFRAHQALRAHDLKSVEATGLNLTDFGILEVLLHKGSLPVNTIGEKILLTSGSLTIAVDRLETRGLVRRKSNPGDRRVRLVELTPKGRKLIEKHFEAHEAALEKATSGLNAAEKKQAVALLKKLGHEAERLLSLSSES